MIRLHSAGLTVLLAATLAAPANAQRHKAKNVEVMEWALQTLLVFPDPATGLYVWAEWKDPSIGEAHVGRFDPADIEAFIASAQELISQDRPSDLSQRYAHSDPIQDIDQGHMQLARYLDGEFWARDYTLQLFRTESATLGMDVTMTKKDIGELLDDLREIVTKTKWEPDYHDGIMHGNPAILRTMPGEDPDNEPITYPVVLLDAGLSRHNEPVQGDTFISFVLDENGELDKKSIRVWMSDHRSFSREVTGKVKNWQFYPVVIDGVAIPVHVFFRIPFRIEVRNK